MAERDDLGLFQGFGIEIEWMIVDAETLDVRGRADWLLAQAAGPEAVEHVDGPITWVNELARHLVEAKSTDPMPDVQGQQPGFADAASKINAVLAQDGLCLLPGPMHPWMNPATEYQLFPHGQHDIYALFDRVFDCRGHGWTNLQSTQINLPFSGDAEFGALMAAVRVLLPVLPSLSAGSPYVEGRRAAEYNHRLAVYASNCARVPSITAQVIPEPVFTTGAFRDQVLAPITRDMAQFDPGEILEAEWVNARGAIVRFSRNCIEIRVLDCQESPMADLALCELVVATARNLVEQRWSGLATQQAAEQRDLVRAYKHAVRGGEHAEFSGRAITGLFGAPTSTLTGHALWAHLIEQAAAAGQLSSGAELHLEHWLRHGSLATRLIRAAGEIPTRPSLHRAFAALAQALADNSSYQ